MGRRHPPSAVLAVLPRRLCAVVSLALLGATAIRGQAAVDPTTRPPPRRAARLATADGAITPPLADYLEHTIERGGRRTGAGVAGHRDGHPRGTRHARCAGSSKPRSTRQIPVVLYVYPQGARAASAGVYILMGADVAAMAPQTNLGSAHPVSLTGEMDETMKAKVTNDAAAYMRGLATTHERNADVGREGCARVGLAHRGGGQSADVIEFVAADLDDLLRQLDGYTTVPKGITLHTAGAPVVRSR